MTAPGGGWRGGRKPLRSVAALALVCGVLASGAWLYVGRAGGARIAADPRELQPATAGLVLGTSAMLRAGQPNFYFAARIAAAARLYAAGKARYLIVSGDREGGGRAAGDYDEPTDMRDALVAAGVPAERIYRDDAGFHTRDSVLRAREVFGQDEVIVVSQRFHLERALFFAAANGLSFQGLEAQDVPMRQTVNTRLREIVSRLVAVVEAATGHAPSYGGPKIRIGVDPPS